MGAAEARDEVVLESLDGAFSPVAAVEPGWSELILNVFVCHEVFEELGCFVVKTMEFGTETAMLEKA